MRLLLLCVGRVRGPLQEAVAEYERRIDRYFRFEAVEVAEMRAGKGVSDAEVRAEESARLLARVPEGFRTVVLDRRGNGWSSEKLAEFIDDLAVTSHPGAAFLIGGALGLSPECIRDADQRLSLSEFTLPHEVARLVLAEQLYRAGTIQRGEPYHKGEG